MLMEFVNREITRVQYIHSLCVPVKDRWGRGRINITVAVVACVRVSSVRIASCAGSRYEDVQRRCFSRQSALIESHSLFVFFLSFESWRHVSFCAPVNDTEWFKSKNSLGYCNAIKKKLVTWVAMERNWAVRELLPVLTATTSLYVKNFEADRRRWRLRLPKTDYASSPHKYVNVSLPPDMYEIYDSVSSLDELGRKPGDMKGREKWGNEETLDERKKKGITVQVTWSLRTARKSAWHSTPVHSPTHDSLSPCSTQTRYLIYWSRSSLSSSFSDLMCSVMFSFVLTHTFDSMCSSS